MLITGDEVRIKLDVTSGYVTAVFPPHGDPAFEKAKKELLDGRFETSRRGRIRNTATEARIRFFDAQCQRIEGWQHRQSDGTLVDPMTLPNWRELFPVNLKISAAVRFEETEALDEEEREGLSPTSVGR